MPEIASRTFPEVPSLEELETFVEQVWKPIGVEAYWCGGLLVWRPIGVEAF